VIKVEVFREGGSLIKSWAVNPEQGAKDQAINLSKLPFVISHVALMPDAHQGYGMPIGGVLFADNAVVPYAIGVDIGCGVQLIETSVTVDDLTPEKVKKFLDQVSRDIPTGNGAHGEHTGSFDKGFWESGATKTVPLLEGLTDRVIAILDYAEKQLGTLGGGNHFLELQRSNDGRIWFMLHSGSRSVGKKICDYWHKEALKLNIRWNSTLPHKELAYVPFDSPEGQGYWTDMQIALAWAEENRLRMAEKVIDAFGLIFKADANAIIDVHHNYATWEHHLGRNGIVHRKGAVRANVGEQVLIPGSMGTSSWLAEGLGNPQSFNTCQHGAGRARSRGDTRRSTSLEEMDAQLESVGVTLVTNDRGAVIDESAIAYKDIDEVMAASTDLIKPVMQLWPVGVVKG